MSAPRDLEFSAGGPPMAAYRSLARSRNVDLHTVLRAVEENRLADVVRLPDRDAELRTLDRAIARRDHINRLGILYARDEVR